MTILGFDLPGARPWETPELVAINRLPMRSSMSASPVERLDGEWRFAIANSPDDAVPGFTEPGFNDADWAQVAVPGLFTMQGFASPIYTNIQMPFRPRPPNVPADNPTGLYRRSFSVPSEWNDRRVVLHFGGAESVLFVWVNGVAIGMSKDSRLAAEFDVSDNVHFGGNNTLAAMVVRWSDASYVEDQDQWWHAGLHREVLLYSTAHTYIADVHLSAAANGRLTGRVEIAWDMKVKPDDGWTVDMELLSSKGLRVGRKLTKPIPCAPVVNEFEGYVARFEMQVPKVDRWTHETPNLYRVAVTLRDPAGSVVEVESCRVGFRDTEVRGQEFLLNGAPVLIYGVNRHDFDPDTGRVVTEEQMRADIVLLKQFGFNAVRASHSPNDPRLLDICDELGMLVIDEANIENHALNFSLCHDGRYLEQVLQRGRRMVQRDKNHPCVVMWSLGNESGYGANHDALAGWIRHYDPTRPLHYEGAIMFDWHGGHRATDVVCPMYPTIAAIKAGAKSLNRPIILCEYSHAMGNSNGTLAEYFDAFQNTFGLQGGFIWEFWDHGLRQRLPDGSTRFSYGGDWGERNHDANFCCDGVVWPDRTPKPVMHEHRYLARPVSFEPVVGRAGRARITNRQFFLGTDSLRFTFEVAVEGTVVAKGRLAPPTIAPRKSATVTLPVAWSAVPAGECVVTIRQRVARGTGWCDAGFEIGHDQWIVERNTRSTTRRRQAAPRATTQVVASPRQWRFCSEGLESVVDRTTGRLSSLVIDATEVLAESPRLTLWRAPIDNDGLKLALGKFTPFARWREWGLDALSTTCVSTRLTRRNGAPVVTSVHQLAGTESKAVVHHRQQMTFNVDGSISFAEDVRIPDRFADLPRIGVRLQVASRFDTLRWHGRGPHECYPDRQRGAALGIHQSTVADQYVPYIMPQEHGLHTDTRWMELVVDSSRRSAGIRISSSQPFMFSALKHSPEQLTVALHDVELKPEANTTLHIDHRHRGLGSASCGPDTLDQYRIRPGRYRWTWLLSNRETVPPTR